MKAGMIGLGAMGGGMARNVAKAGLLSGVYNRTFDKSEALAAELNVNAYESPEALAETVDVVLICVSADRDVLGIVERIASSLKPGTVVVDHSTVGSETARQAADILSACDVSFLDAPVSGGVEGANNGTLAMMAGGPTDALERVRPVLEAMAARIIHVGETGSGQATKAVNQILCAGINEAVTEALAFGEAQGLPMAKVIEAIAGGAGGNWFLDKRGLTMIQGIFKPGFKLALHHKDLQICQAMAQASGIDIPLTDAADGHYRQLIAEGFGNEDISAMYRLKRVRTPQSKG